MPFEQWIEDEITAAIAAAITGAQQVRGGQGLSRRVNRDVFFFARHLYGVQPLQGMGAAELHEPLRRWYDAAAPEMSFGEAILYFDEIWDGGKVRTAPQNHWRDAMDQAVKIPHEERAALFPALADYPPEWSLAAFALYELSAYNVNHLFHINQAAVGKALRGPNPPHERGLAFLGKLFLDRLIADQIIALVRKGHTRRSSEYQWLYLPKGSPAAEPYPPGQNPPPTELVQYVHECEKMGFQPSKEEIDDFLAELARRKKTETQP